jgi:RNA polymerase primary sigma factor
LDTQVENREKIGSDAADEVLYQIGLDALVEDLEKDIQTEDAHPKDAVSEDTFPEGIESENAKNIDIDSLTIYLNERKRHRSLLDHEQEYWLAMDIQAGMRLKQALSSDGITGVYSDLRDNWDQYSTMVESLKLSSIDWNRAISEMTHQRLNKKCMRFSEIFSWLENVNDHTEVRQKISRHAIQIYLDLIILPIPVLSMIASHFSRDYFALPDGNEIDHWFKSDTIVEWPADGIFTQAAQAKERLILSNLHFVIYKAKKYYFSGPEFVDLLQQGNLGLISSIEKYDPSIGDRFSTYAASWIRKEITRYIFDDSNIFYFSEDKSEKRKLVYKACERLSQQLQRLPTAKEIAYTIDSTTAAEVANLLEYDIKIISCNEPVDESDDYVLEDIIEELDPIDLVNRVDLQSLKKDIQIVLSLLPANLREMIILRFGFDGQERTLKEIGDTLGTDL